MADELGAGLQVPGANFDTKGLLSQLRGNADASAAYNKGAEADFTASQGREEAARAAQQTALAPTRDKLKAQLEQGAPAAPELKEAPTPPSPGIDPAAMKETLSLVTALAAFGGALTKQPLTAALNNFSAGVQGYVQGNQEAYKNGLKDFEANLQKSKTENDAIWKRYEAAQKKYGTDIAGLQGEMQLIAAETQNPIDMELAKRGDIVSLMKMHETTNNNYNKVLEQTLKVIEQQRAHDEARKDRLAIAGQASADRRALGGIGPDGGFNGKNGELLAALAEKGVSLPAGFRSKQQQISLLNGLIERNPGLSPDQIADKVKTGKIDLANQTTKGRVAAGIAGRVAYAENELQETIPLVREAAAKVPRGKFMPFNRLRQATEQQLSDPDLKEYAVYMTSLSNAYDMLAARGGTDKDKRAHSRAMFDTADSPEALDRALKAIEAEAKVSGRAAEKSMQPGGSSGEPAAGGWSVVK